MLLLATAAAFGVVAPPALAQSSSWPLPPDYQLHADGSVILRVCFNWSCASRQRMSFSAAEMKEVARQMALCPGEDSHHRLQRVRIGIWQMEALAQKHQPLLANDEAINDHDQHRDGRMDCIDNSSNTTSFLNVLRDLGLLPGWSVAPPRIRDRFSLNVHWTAVVVDAEDDQPWAVDSWFRANGNLPFVMPLADWEAGRIPWQAPLAGLNPYPRYAAQLCAG